MLFLVHCFFVSLVRSYGIFSPSLSLSLLRSVRFSQRCWSTFLRFKRWLLAENTAYVVPFPSPCPGPPARFRLLLVRYRPQNFGCPRRFFSPTETLFGDRSCPSLGILPRLQFPPTQPRHQGVPFVGFWPQQTESYRTLPRTEVLPELGWVVLLAVATTRGSAILVRRYVLLDFSISPSARCWADDCMITIRVDDGGRRAAAVIVTGGIGASIWCRRSAPRFWRSVNHVGMGRFYCCWCCCCCYSVSSTMIPGWRGTSAELGSEGHKGNGCG